MNDRHKFRGRRVDNDEWVIGYFIVSDTAFSKNVHRIIETKNGMRMDTTRNGSPIYSVDALKIHEIIPETLGQYIGLEDKKGKLYYHGDIGVFDNGDKFVIECEEWMEFYVEWIGEAECEDQSRDFYRISRATIIGNTHDKEKG